MSVLKHRYIKIWFIKMSSTQQTESNLDRGKLSLEASTNLLATPNIFIPTNHRRWLKPKWLTNFLLRVMQA